MIENETQLKHSIQTVARMYGIREREASETLWDPDTRMEMAAGTDAMISKIEREIAEYLAKKYNLARELEEVAA